MSSSLWEKMVAFAVGPRFPFWVINMGTLVILGTHFRQTTLATQVYMVTLALTCTIATWVLPAKAESEALPEAVKV